MMAVGIDIITLEVLERPLEVHKVLIQSIDFSRVWWALLPR